jgi:tetratricopeptide (TPR) repeat protein
MDNLPPWLPATAIVVLTLLAYSAVWSAGFVWDDDKYVFQNSTLHDLHGLFRIWFEVGAVPQYYPLVHSTFWLEYHLWDLHPAGYHIDNVLLHALAAVLLGLLLRQLRLPGAWLVAALFAVHPVNVESVAWITERKNVLCGVFYFAAALAWFRYNPVTDTAPGPRRWYYLSLLFFILALFSKTVACSLPVALLLVIWWKRGRIRAGDLWPLLPFFAAGLGLGMLTSWTEKHHVGAEGMDWTLTLGQRGLIAGRALWFYAGKLFCPANLTFIYPRWNVDTAVWWQWLFPLAAIAVVTALWLCKKSLGRGPLAAVLFFAVTLFPALGFVNVYPMLFSFVADHFQYLAGVGLLVLLAGAADRFAGRWQRVLLILPPALAVLTWRQTLAYHDIETLWRDTLRKNPACWLAEYNLGAELVQDGKPVEAGEHLRRALQLQPQEPLIHYNLGLLLAQQGRFADALEEYLAAVKSNPGSAQAHNGLGNTLARLDRTGEAIQQFQTAVELEPGFVEARNNLGLALIQQDRLDEGIAQLQQATRQQPDDVSAQFNLGRAFAAKNDFAEAVREYELALQYEPDFGDAHNELGIALARLGRFAEAAAHFREALRQQPADADLHFNLASALNAAGDRQGAMAEYAEVLKLNPGDEAAAQQLRKLGGQTP